MVGKMDEKISGKINRKGMANSDCNLVFFFFFKEIHFGQGISRKEIYLWQFHIPGRQRAVVDDSPIPVGASRYQILTHRPQGSVVCPHMHHFLPQSSRR